MQLPNLDRKQVLIVGAGSLVLLLLWRWYASRSAPAQSASDQMSDTNPGYSDLAGQLQSAGAALQNQEQGDVQGLAATEAADIGALSGLITQIGDQYAGLGNQLGTLQSQVADLPGPTDVTGITEQVNALAAGQTKANRTSAAALSTAKAAAWNANPNHTVSYAQHQKNVAAGHPASHQSTGHKNAGSVAPSSHHAKPNVKAKPKSPAHKAAPVHSTPKAGTKPSKSTSTHSVPKKVDKKHPAHGGRR